MDNALLQQRQSLRTHMRRLRRSLSEQQQRDASQQLTERALCFIPIQQAQRIALFLPMDGEIDTRPLIAKLWHNQQQVYLPRIDPLRPHQLLFQHYTLDTQLVDHPLGLQEPLADHQQCCTLTDLDLVLVPLVAFDDQGQRLGMGGGFYDRALVDWQQQGILPIGIAHDCQHIGQLPTAAWDVPLPAIITPTRLWQWPAN